ncbi:[protein-PII] uridylyltransferase family protein [Humidesulfovibrio sp.]
MDDTASHTPALPPAALRLRQGRLALAQAARSDPGCGSLRAYPAASAALMDTYFRERLTELRAQSPVLFHAPFVLAAVGGYGRSELCPASDVDVLLLYETAIPKNAEELSRGLFHPLWDLGLDLGHGVRVLADCLRLAVEDPQVLTSLLDARRIDGEPGLAKRLEAELTARVLRGRAPSFGQWVLEHNAGRRAAFGDSSGLLEPDLKNGLGGLRDVHQVRWLMRLLPSLAPAGPNQASSAQASVPQAAPPHVGPSHVGPSHAAPGHTAPFTLEDLAQLEFDYDFVLSARTALHLAAGRKNDRLHFDLQPQVARALGFSGPGGNTAEGDGPGDSPPDSHGGQPGEPLGDGLATGLAVEAFLSRLHQCMTRIRTLRQACWLEAFPPRAPLRPFLCSSEGIFCGPTGMALRDPIAAVHNPGLILELYVAAARAARPVCWSALRATRAALADTARRAAFAGLPGILPALVEIFRASGQPTESSPPQAAPPKPEQGGLVRAFSRIFAPAPANGSAPPAPVADLAPAVATALQSMLDTGLMSALVPEFGPVEHLVQFDDFHIHPVGKHTLEVVRALAALLPVSRGGAPAPDISPELRQTAGDLPHFERLLLAGFCHDLAKPDRDHSASGAKLADNLLARLGADADTRADVAFLVREHLLIPKVATRRDLADESVVAAVAEACGSVERLDMLHLLAVADSQSTGPRAWSPWTASLMAELARKAGRLLTAGPLAEPHAVKKSRQVREAAQALALQPFAGLNGLEPPLDAEHVERCLERMPARAFLVLDAPTVARHLRLAQRFRQSLDEDLVRKPAGKAGIGVAEIDAVAVKGRAYQVSIAALDRPGLFAVMAGVLALHDLNILSADVLTWPMGSAGAGASLAVDVFLVEEPADGLHLDDLWDRVRRAVSYALTGKLSLEYRLDQKRSSPLVVASRAPKGSRKVRVDNEQSDFFSLVEVAAPDRLGLLHDLAQTLCAHGLRIHLARIATSAGRIHDVFYVRTDEGMKLKDPARIEELRAALLEAAKAKGGYAPAPDA